MSRQRTNPNLFMSRKSRKRRVFEIRKTGGMSGRGGKRLRLRVYER